jgi:hypothetical protein
LKDLPSALSLAWMTIVLPTTFSEIIALKLRRPKSPHPYLYPQIFSGISYLLAGLCILELGRVLRKRRKAEALASMNSGESGTSVSVAPAFIVANGGVRDEKEKELDEEGIEVVR